MGSAILSGGAQQCRAKFLRYFKKGFRDETFLEWERGFKQRAHEQWMEALNRLKFESLLRGTRVFTIAKHAVQIESQTSLLSSFEKMALRDAVKYAAGAKLFSTGLHRFFYGTGGMEHRFEQWCAAIAGLPRRQTRVLTWPLVTLWGFLAEPEQHIFLKPTVTRKAAANYGFDFHYDSKPNWETYRSLLEFAETIRLDNLDLKPVDMIDLQSFIWVQGSDEYPD